MAKLSLINREKKRAMATFFHDECTDVEHQIRFDGRERKILATSFT